jgi:hypothetical protein
MEVIDCATLFSALLFVYAVRSVIMTAMNENILDANLNLLTILDFRLASYFSVIFQFTSTRFAFGDAILDDECEPVKLFVIS